MTEILSLIGRNVREESFGDTFTYKMSYLINVVEIMYSINTNKQCIGNQLPFSVEKIFLTKILTCSKY